MMSGREEETGNARAMSHLPYDVLEQIIQELAIGSGDDVQEAEQRQQALVTLATCSSQCE